MAGLSFRVLPVFTLTATVLASAGGCPQPPVTGPEDAGNINLSDAGPFVPPADAGFDDAGEAIVVDAGPVNTAVVVDSVTPPAGPMAGLNRVRIEGNGFTGACNTPRPEGGRCQVFFGDVEGDLILPGDLPTSITVRVPPCAAPGPVTVRVITELGIGELEGGYTCFSPVTLASIDPAEGPTAGGTPVTVEGVGFTADMVVTVGGRQVADLVVDPSGTSATFFTPPGSVGRADVTAIDGFGRSALELAFTYHGTLALDSVTPNVVEDTGGAGGEPIDLHGSGLSARGADVAAATIGGAAAATDNAISDARLRVTLPGGLAGTQDVAVARGAETALLEDALVVLGPPTGVFSLAAAIPPRADAAGGTAVTLAGEGLTTATGVTVAGVAATDVTVVDDRRLTFTAPAGTVGPATIEVTRADASTAQLATFAYVEALAVESVAPAAGPSAGGTAVTISGRAFADPAQVFFGGMPATDVVVVSATEITATAPAGAAGFVDVVVLAGGARATLDDGYRFDAALSVVGVRPSRGASGGDTFVTITGTGFSRGPVTVTFGGTPAVPLDVVVVNDSTITLRTPPHEPGLIDVEVVQGQATVTGTDLFTYFNAAGNFVGGTRGGPIDGAVYITAFDESLGLPIPGLVAYVGTDGTPVASGLTNVFGQATISGPEIVGPQTVTVVGDCFASATFVDVNATELTVFLTPLCPEPGPPGPGTPPPPLPTIRGRVFGFAKEFFDPAALDQSGCVDPTLGPCEIAFAEVRTTSASEFAPAFPAGGDNIVFEEGGEYFIAQSRTGRLALVAVAGIFDINNQTFRLRQMGVRRELFPERGDNLEDQDIELTIPLDEEIDLSLPDAPLRFDTAQIGFKPTITRVIPFIQLGGEGTFNYTQAVEGKRNHELEEMPELPGEMLTFIAGAYTTDGRNLLADNGTVDVVAGQEFVTGFGTAAEWSRTDFNGNLLIVGAVFVTDRPDGSRFASVILGSPDPQTIQLQDPPDFSVTGASYHIGDPGAPSSEVIQDGVGDLRGGITIQPVLGLPEALSPEENGVLVDRTLRWKAAPGQQPSLHAMFIFEPFALESFWLVFADGARTKVILPRVPTREAIAASLPTAQRLCLEDPTISPACGFYGALEDFVPPSDMALGGMVWQHQAIFTPGLGYDNWSFLEIGARGRRAWTTDVHVFVKGQD